MKESQSFKNTHAFTDFEERARISEKVLKNKNLNPKQEDHGILIKAGLLTAGVLLVIGAVESGIFGNDDPQGNGIKTEVVNSKD